MRLNTVETDKLITMKADLELEVGVVDRVQEDIQGAGSKKNAFLIRYAYRLITLNSTISN